jgi:serine/threonine protein kinase
MAHPTIVRIYDAGEETTLGPGGAEIKSPFIVMEYVEGRLLKDLIAEGPVESREAVRVTDGILTALEYSHRAGVVHRDIKPGNVMITRQGQVKVMDFGIARAISDGSATVAQTTAILGTASYFSPEQAKGETVDTRTDLYSTGVVLFEMLTGKAPFTGDTAISVAYQHVSEKPAPPSTLNNKISPALDTVVLHALSKNRFARYQSASDFRHDLKTAADGHIPEYNQSQEFSLFGAPTQEPSESELVLKQLAEDNEMARTQSRPPVVWIWAGVVIIGVILISVLIWVLNLERIEIVPDITREVPALVGLSYEEAENRLYELDLLSTATQEANADIPNNHIVRTEPSAGTKVSRDTTIKLFVSLGRPSVRVPDVTNQPLSDAQTVLTNVGLTYGAINRENSPTIPSDVVIRTDPAPQTAAHHGDTINLTVSSGSVALPDLRGQSLSAAIDILAGSNLQLSGTAQPDDTCAAQPNSAVIAQSLPPGDVPT